jgi:hypothetical protein
MPTPSRIRVRDIVRGDLYELPPEEPALRGSYDLFRPSAGAIVHDGLAEWSLADQVRVSRVAHTTLGDVHPGECVLVRLGKDDQWWLCEVLQLEGFRSAVSRKQPHPR